MDIANALKFKYPGKEWYLDGETYDGLVWLDQSIDKPTKAEVTVAWGEYVANRDASKYKTDRLYGNAPIYASIQEQLDMQYWDLVNGTTTWKDHIAAVKTAHPKPSK